MEIVIVKKLDKIIYLVLNITCGDWLVHTLFSLCFFFFIEKPVIQLYSLLHMKILYKKKMLYL